MSVASLISVLTFVSVGVAIPAASEVPMSDKPRPEYASVKQVCERFGWHKSTVHRKLTRKLIAGKKDGRKTLIVLQSVIDHVKNLPDR
jgi:hypothetical protein